MNESPQHSSRELEVGLRQIAGLAVSISEYADEIRQRCEELAELAGGVDVAAPAPARTEEPAATGRGATNGSGALGADRLVAIQMALSGHTRDETSERLRRGFGIEDPGGLLDDVFGQAV